jgi:hypothetical protein
MRVDPGGGGVSVSPVPHNQPIDQTKVSRAVQQAEVSIPYSQSNLANVLTNPTLDLNQAERDQVIQDLARQGGQPWAFYANDFARRDGSYYASMRMDQAVIADAVQQAYADGAINTNDLVHIANLNQSQDGGGQRLLGVLMQGEAASEQGSAAEALANALWARNGNSGTDRAAAAMYYTCDALTMQNDLNTPVKRQEAFEALVSFNQSGPYSNVPPGQLATAWKNQAIAAEANLFIGNSRELTQEYTLRDAMHTPDTQVLAKFMSQTVFNPSAQNIQLNDFSSLKDSLPNSLANVSSTLMSTARQAPPGSLQEHYAIEEYGRLSAALSGGAALALTNYDAQVQANDAAKNQWADLVGGVVGKVIKVDTPFGNPAEDLAKEITKQVYQLIVHGPERPTASLADTLYQHYAQNVEQLRTEPGQPTDLTSDFDSTYGATLLNLQGQLNVNLGGHAN